jgi:hypothetical protein
MSYPLAISAPDYQLALLPLGYQGALLPVTGLKPVEVGFTAYSPQSDEEILAEAVLKIFPSGQITCDQRTDPEEGWTRPVLTVHTGLGDLEAKMVREDAFYDLVATDARLAVALRAITVLFD